MELEGNKFGRGPRELTGAVDLISRYKLLPFHDFFCKKPLPVSVADTHYLHNIVGDTEIRKGDGMLLGQLVQTPSSNRDENVRILPIELRTLGEAFHLRETACVVLPLGEKGVPTIAEKSKIEFVDKDKKHKKKHKEKHKDKEHKKSKHRHKDRSIDKEKKKDKIAHQVSGPDFTMNRNEKRKKNEIDQDASNMHKRKRSKHIKSSTKDELGRIKVAG